VVADLVQDDGGALGVVEPVGVDGRAGVGLGVVNADGDELRSPGAGVLSTPAGEDGVDGFGGGELAGVGGTGVAGAGVVGAGVVGAGVVGAGGPEDYGVLLRWVGGAPSASPAAAGHRGVSPERVVSQVRPSCLGALRAAVGEENVVGSA